MSLRPSALPKLALCACYESNPTPGPAAERGTHMDSVFRARVAGEPDPADVGLSDSDLANVDWAVTALRAMAGGEPALVAEDQCRVHVPGFAEPGTADAIVPSKFFHADLKTGQKRNYREQMAAYALGLMEQHFASDWTAHLLFCDQREIITHTFTHREALALVERLVAAYHDDNKQPILCEYCSWCAKATTCPARTAAVSSSLATTGFDFAAILGDPDRLGRFLTACSVLDDFREQAQARARELLAANTSVPGWKLAKSRVAQFVNHTDVGRHMKDLGFGDVLAAYGNLSAKKFRALWEAKLPSRPFPEEVVKEGKSSRSLVADQSAPSLTTTNP